MTIPILTAKLRKPLAPVGLISREAVLKSSVSAQVILVSAQAGSGKTTVVSTWLSQQDKVYCWYSLDDWDNDLMQFFTYLAEGLKEIDKEVSQTLRQMIDTYQSIGFDTFLKALINQLHTVQKSFILVFDDYHVIRCEQVHQALRTLLEHFPPQMQLVIITREDPPLPLAKLRAGRKLLEVRISDLRFTEDEAKAYFLKHLSVSLEEAQLQQLIKRTEGWAAGIQMAALSMQGLDDIDGFIEAFTGSHYYVMDYLMEEVLERQPPDIKTFLLTTSIPDIFSCELCDALLQLVPGTSNSIIQRLVKTNSFIIPMDSSYKWYRYHHLFRELLTQRLAQQPPAGGIEPVHYRAGLWYKANGREQEAIHHLFLANAPREAAELIECRWAEMDMRLQSTAWLDMAKKLPPEILQNSPVLAMGYGWALLDKGDAEACKVWFEKALGLYNLYQAAERPVGMIIKDTIQFNLLPATVASAYAYIAAAEGDVEGTFRHSLDALTKLPEDQYFKRSIVETLLGFAYWEKGDLHEAEIVIVRSIKGIVRAVMPFVENSYHMVLGELYIQQGNIGKAKALFEQTISRLVKEKTDVILLPALYLGLAKIAFLQGDNLQAYNLLEQSKVQGLKYALMDWRYKYYLLLARVYCSEGLYDLARSCIRESRAHYYFNPIPEDVRIDDVERQIEIAAQHQTTHSENTKDKKDPAFMSERANQTLPEPLTARELEVLSLIISGLSNQDICNTLFLALSTVKGYNQSIYEKLGVNRRTQAILVAREIGLA